MAENMKNKSATTKGVEDKSAAKKDAEKDKDAEKKPAADAGAGKEKGLTGRATGDRAVAPLLSVRLRRPGRGLQAGEKLDQVAELGLAQLGGHVGGHGRGTALAILDRVFRDGDGLAFGGDEPHFFGVFAAQDSGVHLAVAGGEHHRLESLSDLLVGAQDRLEQIGPARACAPTPERSGPTSPPVESPPGPRTLWQRMHSTSDLAGEDRPAALASTSCEHLAIRRQRIVARLG